MQYSAHATHTDANSRRTDGQTRRMNNEKKGRLSVSTAELDEKRPKKTGTLCIKIVQKP